MASMTTATTVPVTSPMKIAPRTCRTTRTQVSSSVNTNTSVGTVPIDPSAACTEANGWRRHPGRSDETRVDQPDEQDEQPRCPP